LRLELGREDFEKTGLEGKPVRTGGKKHAKERYRMFFSSLRMRLTTLYTNWIV
jgi:hypothetical protein